MRGPIPTSVDLSNGSPRVNLTEQHLADLRRTGLSDETIAAAELHMLSARDVAGLLERDDAGSGLAIPYPNCTFSDGALYVRVRLDTPLVIGGDQVRYLTKKGERNQVYVPSILPASVLADPDVPLVITEGEKKTLKACQEGIRCVGLAGVWSWKTKVEGRSVPLPYLDDIAWQGRTVVITFDSDSQTNPSVQKAQAALAVELSARGAHVRIPTLPPGPNGEKVGLDDYLVIHTAEEFQALVARTPEWRPEGQADLRTLPPIKGGGSGGEALHTSLRAFNFAALRRNAQEGRFELHFLPFLGNEDCRLICLGLSTLISGYPKAGKSTLLFHLAHEWAAAGHRILYLTEESEVIWKARVTACREDGLEHMVGIFGLGVRPECLVRRAAHGDEDIVIVDTTNLLGIQDGNDSATVWAALSPWVAMAREKGKTALFAHHTNKSLQGDLKAVAGSYNFAAVVDCVLLLCPGASPNRRVLDGASRALPVEAVMYELQDGQLRCLGDPKGVALEAVAANCVAMLSTAFGQRKTTGEILAAIPDPKPSLAQVQQALTAAAERGGIVRDPPMSHGKKPGTTYRWWVPEAETSPPTTQVLVGREVGGSEQGTLPPVPDQAGEEATNA